MISYFVWDATTCKPIPKVHYLDQIVGGSDGKQDAASVVTMIDALLSFMRENFADIKSIYLVSDNASNYQSSLLLLVLPALSLRYGVHIARYIHTETQDGKSSLDAHFARCGGQIMQYIAKGNDVATPRQIVAAMQDRGGLSNSSVMLVFHDRLRLGKIFDRVAKIAKACDKHFKRVNEVLISNAAVAQPEQQPQTQTPDEEFGLNIQFALTVFSHSSVGDGLQLQVDLANNSVKKVAGNISDETFVEDTDDNVDSMLDLEGLPPDECDEDEDGAMQLAQAVEKGYLISGDAIDVPAQAAEKTLEFCGAKVTVHCAPPNSLPRSLQSLSGSNEATAGVDGAQDSDTQQSRKRKRAFPSKTISGFAIRRASQLLHNSLVVRDAHDEPTEEFDEIRSQPVHFTLSSGWARRPPRGQYYGVSYVPRFEKELHSIFMEGVEDSSKKCNAAEMIEELKSRFPDRLDMPFEYHVKSKIGEWSTAVKKGKDVRLSAAARGVTNTQDGDGPVGGSASRGRKPLHVEYVPILEQILRDQPDIKPALAWTIFQDAHGHKQAHDPDSPTVKWFKAKLAVLKRNAKDDVIQLDTDPQTS